MQKVFLENITQIKFCKFYTCKSNNNIHTSVINILYAGDGNKKKKSFEGKHKQYKKNKARIKLDRMRVYIST